jgi:hypothetical protein
MSESTLISLTELSRRCTAEGIDPSAVCVIVPRWAESAPRTPGSTSWLATCDLILRDDGSCVLLDGCMSRDGMHLAHAQLTQHESAEKGARHAMEP